MNGRQDASTALSRRLPAADHAAHTASLLRRVPSAGRLLFPDFVCGKMEHSELSLELYVVQGSFSGTATGLAGDMEETVWSKLPEELVGRVLLALPPTSQFRFRAVCKQWRSFLSSAQFQSQASILQPPSPSPPMICVFCFSPSQQRGPIPASSLSRYPAYKLNLNFIPSRFHSVLSSKSVGMRSLYDTHSLKKVGYERTVVSQDGLILIRVCELVLSTNRLPDSSCELYVVNPFTRTCMRLPQIGIRPDPFGMIKVEVDKASNASFKVVVIYDRVNACPMYNPWIICVFSSVTHTWKTIQGERPPHDIRPRLSAQKFADVVSNGVLYRYDGGQEGVLLVHNIEEGTSVWHRAIVPDEWPPAAYSPKPYFLVECRGNVFYVGPFRSGEDASYGIWRLELNSMQWLLVSVPPAQVLATQGSLATHCSRWLEYACAEGDMIFLTIRVSDPPARTLLLGFSIVKTVWHLLLNDEAPHLLATKFYGFLVPRWNL